MNWNDPNHNDPEWTNADGSERGPGAILWLVVAIMVLMIGGMSVTRWLLTAGG